jgi:tetratricopeptide (TPR) repeat protein/TolB-like protein
MPVMERCLVQVPGQTLSHYRVLEQIGAGGMGVVYRAHDEQLDRDVALKVLPPGTLADDTSRKRFRKEAVALAKLNHPHIATIYEFDTQDGLDFIAMELVCGITLSKRCERPVLNNDLLTIAEQIALAIKEAHDHGIVHGDLKPGNIMVTTRNQIKVLDFGLARPFALSGTATTESVTETHGPRGTLAYMSPEVLRGRLPDHRSDVWSLGVLLYEVSTRRLPFSGRTTFELSSAILKEPPAEIPNGLPQTFKAFLLRCLEKEPSLRYQSASEIVQVLELMRPGGSVSGHSQHGRKRRIALRGFVSALCIFALLTATIPSLRHQAAHWLFATANPQEKQLAVLPLSASADDPEMLAFGNGLAETLAARLIQLSDNHPLQVIPASEVRARGVTTLREAQQEFGVNLGLELSLRRSGGMVRVNYSLVDAQTHHQLGGDTITAPASDVFAVEDKVADSVVKSLNIDLQPQEQRSLTAHGTTEPAAYDYYLQGRGYLQEFQKRENLESAITVFSHALDKDQNFSLAFAGLGEAYWRKYELTQDNRWVGKALIACQKAVSLKADQAEGHACLGLVNNGMGNYAEAAQQYKKAVELEPSGEDGIRGLASAYASLGQMNQAEQTYQAAITARPNDWRGYNALGGLYFSQARYPDAAKMFSQVIALAPDSFRGYSNLGGTYIALGRYSDSVRLFQQSIAIRPTVDAYSNLATAYFQMRKFVDAARNYEEATKLDDKDYTVWGNLADAYYYSGKRQDAFPIYQKALVMAKVRLEVNPKDAFVLSQIANFESVLGNREEALGYMARAFKFGKKNDPDLLFSAALVYNQIGDTNAALEWLAKALTAGYSASTVGSAPAFDNVRSTPQFQELMRQEGKSLR